LEKLVSKNKDKVEILKQIRDNAINIIEEFKIVKDIDVSDWGRDYIYDHDVKRDSLCSINSEKLEQLLDSLENVSLYVEKEEDEEMLPRTCNLFKNLTNLFGMFEDEFILNVVYRRPSEIMRKIIGVSKDIDKSYRFYNRIISTDYLKLSIENCFTSIQRLETKYLASQSQIDKMDKLVKLKSLGAPKNKAISLFDLRDKLKYDFEF
jgi:hypothetical protein